MYSGASKKSVVCSLSLSTQYDLLSQDGWHTEGRRGQGGLKDWMCAGEGGGNDKKIGSCARN